MPALDDLRQQVLKLVPEERAVLACDLLDSLETSPPEADVESAWAEEIEARSEAFAAGELSAMPWRQAVDEIEQDLRERQP